MRKENTGIVRVIKRKLYGKDIQVLFLSKCLEEYPAFFPFAITDPGTLGKRAIHVFLFPGHGDLEWPLDLIHNRGAPDRTLRLAPDPDNSAPSTERLSIYKCFVWLNAFDLVHLYYLRIPAAISVTV